MPFVHFALAVSAGRQAEFNGRLCLLIKMIKRLVTLWCSPRVSNSLLVSLLLKQTLFPFLHEHRLF